MYPKPNLNNDLCDVTCDKDLVIENKILKVKSEDTNEGNKFLWGEAEDLYVLLNVKVQTSSHIFKTKRNKCLLHENSDTQSLYSFQITSSKSNMLQNQNNFSNKSNSFISQMNSGLATPATSDLELKSSIHSSHYRKILELFIKSSVLDFAID